MTAAGAPQLHPPPGPPPNYGGCDPAIGDRLPRRLRRGPWFVAWRWEWRDGGEGQAGRWTKVPVNCRTGGRASSTAAETWVPLADAVRFAVQHGLPGIGLMFQGSGLFGIDLDACLDPRTGELAPWAAPILARFPGAWREKSPSRTGIHLIGEGQLPGKGRNTRRPEGGGVECYDAGRFFTLTGDVLPESPPEPGDCQEAVTSWYRETYAAPESVGPDRPATGGVGATGFDDAEVVRRCESGRDGDKFRRLFWNGDLSDYTDAAGKPNHSSADLGLCNYLRFWSGDRAQVERLFGRSALGQRPKWNRPDYRAWTLDKAMDGDVYTPPLEVDLGFETDERTNGKAHAPAAAAAGAAPPPGGGPRVPRIDAGVQDLRIVTDQAWRALKRTNEQAARLFRHGGVPVRIEPDDNGKPVLRELTPDRVRHELARAAEFWLTTKSGAKIVAPPKPVVLDVLATPDPPLPVVTRLTECPTFAPDGTLQTEPGYHAASRTYCMGRIAGLRPVPETPTDADVRSAVALYQELFCDFPFVGDADRANALAAGLLIPARDLIDGPTPLHGVEAPTPGSGKGLLVEALLRPFCGSSYGSFTQCRDDDEWRKQITSMLRDGFPAILVDNVARTLDSGILASALTARVWSDRLLGVNATVRLPVRTVWWMTGNNPTFSTELARRTVPIRIRPEVDRPWERSEFKHKHLLAWVDRHRAELVWAGLVLIRNWLARQRPAYTGPVLGTFEEWSRVMGGILEAAGVEGFLGNVGRFYDTVDLEGAVWREFVEAWWEAHQGAIVGTADLFAIALLTDGLDLGNGTERSQRIKFGKALARQRDRVIGRYRIVEAGEFRRASQWQLLDIHTPDPAPEDGDRVNVAPPETNIHTGSQIGESPDVNVCEGFTPQPTAGEDTENSCSTGVENIHTHSQHSHAPPPVDAPGRPRPRSVAQARAAGGGWCTDASHPVWKRRRRAGENAWGWACAACCPPPAGEEPVP